MASGKRGGVTPAPAPVSALDRVESRERLKLAEAAQRKVAQGEAPTVREAAALRAVKSEQLASFGQQYAHACPKRDLSERTGVSQKVLGEQSRRFGLTYHTSGKTVDLFAELAAWHAWAAEHKHLITRMLKSKQLAEVLGEGEEASLEFWQTELVKERTLKERDARAERYRELQPADVLWDFLQIYFVEPARRRQEHCDQREDPIDPAEAAAWYRSDLEALQRAAHEMFVTKDQAFEELGS